MALTVDLTAHYSYWTLRLDGDLEYEEAARFRMALDRILSSPNCSVLLDLSCVAYMDSSALGLLLSFYKKCTAQGGSVVLITGPVTDQLLDLTRLRGVFPQAESRETALLMLPDEVREPRRSSGASMTTSTPAMEAE